MTDAAVAPYEDMSPTLLASQPPTTNKPTPKRSDWTRVFEHLETNLSSLRMWRYSWWVSWQDLAKFILPRRYKWLVTANTMMRGNQLNTAIVDSTATLAMQVCAAGLWTGLTSPSRPWFKIGTALSWVELDEASKAWLEDAEQRVYTVLAQSNFYTQAAQMFQDVTVFGTSPMICYEDAEDVVRFYLPCTGEYALQAGARFSTDGLYREFTLTVQQIVEMFKLENCPQEVRELWNTGGGSWQSEFVVAHAIEPNSPLSPYGRQKGQVRVVPGRFAYREVYWLRGNNTGGPLSQKGFHERCFAVARWATVGNDAYGRSPGMDALGDVKQLQLETARKAEFIEKLVRPPMGADPTMKNQPSSIIPGHVTYTDSAGNRKGFWPLFEVRPEALAPMIADIEKISGRINDCFFVNLFMAISRMEGVQPRNELELTKRDLERLQALGPFITLFETEFADVMIRRVLAILERRRLLKPMPASLRRVPIKINYLSIMRLAQRSAETVSIKDVAKTGGELSVAAKAAGLPDPLRILNLDKLFRNYTELSNVSAGNVFTEDEVARNDASRAKVQQAQHLQAATPAMVDAAKSLSQTPMGGNTALSALLGAGPGAAGV